MLSKPIIVDSEDDSNNDEESDPSRGEPEEAPQSHQSWLFYSRLHVDFFLAPVKVTIIELEDNKTPVI